MNRTKRVISIALALLFIALLAGCMVGDPLLDDFYTKNIYPGVTDTYHIGSATLRYDGGYFREIYLNGALLVPGIMAEVDPFFAPHPATTTGIHGVGAGDIVGTTIVQELDSKTLDSSVGKGTWTASGVWKLPAMFFNGDITTDRWLSQDNNTFLGESVVGAHTIAHTGGAEGYHNTAIGHSALHFLTTGSFNNAWGAHSLFSVTSGVGNVGFGVLAGNKIDTGSFNVMIGDQAGPTADGSYGLYIDISESDTPLIWGNFDTDDVHLHAATRLGLGDTNYTNFGDDGTQTMAGTARVTKDIDIPLTGFGKGVAAPATVYLGNYIGYEYSIDDTAYYSTEVPYDWDTTSDLLVEIHWYINEAYATAPNGEVRWNMLYTATKEDSSEAVDAGTTTVDGGDENIPATAKYLVHTELTIPAAALQAHDVIGLQIKRVALAGGNNPTAKPTLVGALIEYTSNKLGE